MARVKVLFSRVEPAYKVETAMLEEMTAKKTSDSADRCRKEVSSGKPQISLDRDGQLEPGGVEAICHSEG